MFRDLERRLGAALNGFSENLAPGPGESYRLGKGDGTATITNPSGLYAREVWIYRDLASGRSTDFAILPDWMPYEDNANFVGLPVKVGKEPGEKMLRVLRLDGLAGNQTQGNTSLMEGKIQQASHPAVSDISTFRVRATAPTATLDVAIDGPFFYYKPSTSARQVYTGGLPVSTSPTIAATIAALTGTGKHQLAVVCLDPETGTFILVTNSAITPGSALGTRSAHDEFTQDDANNLPTAAYIPGAPFELYDGQASVIEANFYRSFDLRNAWSPFNASSTPLPLTTKGDLFGYSTGNARVPVGSNGQVLIADSTQSPGVKWGAVSAASTGYILLQDQKAANTDGGTFTSGAWQTRVLNTIVADTTSAVTLSGNQFVLPAGTYRIRTSAPAAAVDGHKARLQNITDSSTVIEGTSEYVVNTVLISTVSWVVGRFTIAASKTFEIQHKCITTKATTGFGVGQNLGTEIYTSVEITKE